MKLVHNGKQPASARLHAGDLAPRHGHRGQVKHQGKRWAPCWKGLCVLTLAGQTYELRAGTATSSTPASPTASATVGETCRIVSAHTPAKF